MVFSLQLPHLHISTCTRADKHPDAHTYKYKKEEKLGKKRLPICGLHGAGVPVLILCRGVRVHCMCCVLVGETRAGLWTLLYQSVSYSFVTGSLPEYCVRLESSKSVTLWSPSLKPRVTGAYDYWVLNSGLFARMWEDQSMTLGVLLNTSIIPLRQGVRKL